MNKMESTHKYIEAVGRRKTSIARVRFWKSGKNTVLINEKDIKDYFPKEDMQMGAIKPIKQSGFDGHFSITAKIVGGGIKSQSEALSHGIARVLLKMNPELRKTLKKEGMLKRDSRAKERRKFGLKKARKGPKWSKR